MFRFHTPPGILAATCAALLGQSPQIHVIQDMHFGELVVEDQGGGITLTPEGVLMPYGPAVRATGRSPVREARFEVTGPPGGRFRVELNPPTPFLSEARGAQVRIQSFQWLSGAGEGVFDAQGKVLLRLGARLDVPAGALPGLYMTRQVNLKVVCPGGDDSQSTNLEFVVSARIRPTLRLVNLSLLDFGQLIPGASIGRYTVTAGDGARAEGAGGPRQFKGNPRPAAFFMSGSPGICYSLELPGKVVLTGPGASIDLQDFHCNVPLQASLPAGGLGFLVGASLVIPPGQEPGLYRGTFMVSVDYQ